MFFLIDAALEIFIVSKLFDQVVKLAPIKAIPNLHIVKRHTTGIETLKYKKHEILRRLLRELKGANRFLF
jgi:hypothetical protein